MKTLLLCTINPRKFQRATSPTNASKPKTETLEEEQGGRIEDTHSETEDEQADDNAMLHYVRKQDREQLLVTLTEKTGGQVVAAPTLQQVLDLNRGKRVTTPTRKHIDFCIAPGLSFGVRFFPIIKPATYPRIMKEIILIDEDTKEIIKNELGEVQTDKITKIHTFIEDENSDEAVPQSDRTTAISYGSKLFPMTDIDETGLKGMAQKRSTTRSSFLHSDLIQK